MAFRTHLTPRHEVFRTHLTSRHEAFRTQLPRHVAFRTKLTSRHVVLRFAREKFHQAVEANPWLNTVSLLPDDSRKFPGGSLCASNVTQAKSTMQPVATLEASTKRLPVFCTASNEHRHRYLASGDGGGTVKVGGCGSKCWVSRCFLFVFFVDQGNVLKSCTTSSTHE
jgi:hypothetical protein